MKLKETYYQILKIKNNATAEQITKGRREQALIFHSDKTHNVDSDEQMKRINEAYQVLSDPIKKRIYDQKINNNLNQPPVANPSHQQRNQTNNIENKTINNLISKINIFFKEINYPLANESLENLEKVNAQIKSLIKKIWDLRTAFEKYPVILKPLVPIFQQLRKLESEINLLITTKKDIKITRPSSFKIPKPQSYQSSKPKATNILKKLLKIPQTIFANKQKEPPISLENIRTNLEKEFLLLSEVISINEIIFKIKENITKNINQELNCQLSNAKLQFEIAKYQYELAKLKLDFFYHKHEITNNNLMNIVIKNLNDELTCQLFEKDSNKKTILAKIDNLDKKVYYQNQKDIKFEKLEQRQAQRMKTKKNWFTCPMPENVNVLQTIQQPLSTTPNIPNKQSWSNQIKAHSTIHENDNSFVITKQNQTRVL